MGKYIAKRLLQLIPLLFIVSILAFGLVRILPGGAAAAYLTARNIAPTKESIAAAEEYLGLNQPLLTQYLLWLKKAASFDFGISYATNKAITPEIFGALRNTMGLAAMAVVWLILISVPLGIFSAKKPNGAFDHFSRGFAFLCASAPSFLVGFLFVLLFSVKLKLLPSFGKKDFTSYLMPSLTLALGYIASYSRILRNSLLENMGSTNVLYARARGLTEKRIFRAHTLRNSMIPVISNFCLSIGGMLAGSVIVESVFSWPGMGRLIIGSIEARDYPMIQAYIVIMALLYITVNLSADILCAAINPKIRYEA
ncbi:MAG: ABC transporter permease [Clostridiales bacterium]|nr:ABC transporter permease [Clostridiales bacterium]